MSTSTNDERLSEFAASFAYGSRTDLNFKFLAKLSAEEVAQFLQELLWKLAYAADSDDYAPVADHIWQWQVRGYAAVNAWTYDEGPFTILRRPISEARLLLLTSSGHFVAGNDPKPLGVANMSQAEAIERIDDFLREEPQLSAIPASTPVHQLRVRHGGYDICTALADPNVVFPLAHLRDFVAEGKIGGLAEVAYSFVGACAQTPLLKRTAPKWVEMIQAQDVDAVLLVPV